MNENNENIVYTKGYVDDDGRIAVPGVFLEEGAEVDLAIKVKAGRFEIAMFPSDEVQQEERHEVKDCGISEEEIMRVCSAHNDCSECPLNDYCGEEFADE